MSRVFRHRLRVRYGECDPQGVVFNANYLAYFDVIITEFWREAIGEYTAMIDAGADMVVAETRIRFVGSALFDDELDFELRVTRLGNTALGTQIAAMVGDRPIVAGEMRHVFIDPATKQKRPMPADIRAALEPYAVSEEEGSVSEEEGAVSEGEGAGRTAGSSSASASSAPLGGPAASGGPGAAGPSPAGVPPGPAAR